VLAVCRERTTLVHGLGLGAAAEKSEDLPELLDSRLQMRYFSAAHDLLDQTKSLNNGEHEQGR
jgi:hypothetical protein